MKRIFTIIATLTIFIASNAQDNKPEPGKTGVGFSIIGGVGNRLVLSRTIKNGLEPGIQLGFNQSKTKNSFIDSVNVNTTQGNRTALRTATFTTSGMELTVIPFILKHADIASNIDAFVGLQVPLIFGPGQTTVTNTKIERADYLQEIAVEQKSPSTSSVGVNVVLGAQWFFHKNLAIGTICGIGAAFGTDKGNIESSTVTTNSGSGNPQTIGNPSRTVNTISIRNFKTSSINTFNNFIGFYLTYYL